MITRGGFAGRAFTVLVAVAVAACKRDSTTGPVSTDGAMLRIDAVSTVEIKGTVAESVDPVPTVVVRNEKGQAIPGIQVIFNELHDPGLVGGGTVSNRTVTTDSRGVATPGKWTLGTKSGVYALEARILDEHFWSDDTHRAVAFHADANAAAAATLSKESSFQDSVGLPGDELSAPTILVTDKYGNYVGGVRVAFTVVSGGGSLEKNQDESARFGSASAGKWTLGSRPGLNSIVASVPGLNPVTFNAHALDAGAVTWYDMVPHAVRLIARGSIALCEDGSFELVTIENSDAFPGEWLERQFGSYTITGNVIALRFSPGHNEEGILTGDNLSFMHTKDNWVNYPPENWRFFKRSGK